MKIKFINLENPGQSSNFSYKKDKTSPLEKYEFQDGETKEVSEEFAKYIEEQTFENFKKRYHFEMD